MYFDATVESNAIRLDSDQSGRPSDWKKIT